MTFRRGCGEWTAAYSAIQSYESGHDQTGEEVGCILSLVG